METGRFLPSKIMSDIEYSVITSDVIKCLDYQTVRSLRPILHVCHKLMNKLICRFMKMEHQ